MTCKLQSPPTHYYFNSMVSEWLSVCGRGRYVHSDKRGFNWTRHRYARSWMLHLCNMCTPIFMMSCTMIEPIFFRHLVYLFQRRSCVTSLERRILVILFNLFVHCPFGLFLNFHCSPWTNMKPFAYTNIWFQTSISPQISSKAVVAVVISSCWELALHPASSLPHLNSLQCCLHVVWQYQPLIKCSIYLTICKF